MIDYNYPTVWVGVDDAVGSKAVVKVDGVLVGYAHELMEMVGSALLEDARRKAVPGAHLDQFLSAV